MANTTITTNGTHERQERYVNQIVPLYRKQFVVRSEFGRNYEGSPTAGAVKIPVRNTDVELNDYDVLNGASLTQSATTYLTVPIVKYKAINEKVEGYEASAVPDNLRAQRLESGGYTIGKTLELNSINVLVDGGTDTEDYTALSDENTYKKIKDEVINVQKNGVDKREIVVIVSDDTEGKLLEDKKFANSAGMLGAELIREGVIGKVAGARVKTSSLLPEEVDFIVFAKPWAEAIDEFAVAPQFNNLTNEHIGDSALQGKMAYEDVLTKASACRVKFNEDPETA